MLLNAVFVSLILGQGPTTDQGLDQKVTFTEPGAAVPKLVEELSKAAHVQLFAPATFKSDILVVVVKDAPLGDLLKKIGDLSAGDWEKKGDGYELVRSQAKLKAERDLEYGRELKLFQKSIDDEKKKAGQFEAWTAKTIQGLAIALGDLSKSQPQPGQYDRAIYDRLRDLDEKAPGGRTVTRILASLDARELAGLPFDLKVVFSDQPTRMQRSLPSSVIPAMKQMVQEQNLWAEIGGKALPEPQGGFYSNAMWMKKPFGNKAGKVLLMITKTKNGGPGGMNAFIQLAAADEKGRIIVRGDKNLSTNESRGSDSAPKPEPGEEPIEPSPLAKAFKESFDTRTGASIKPLAKEVVDVLIRPEDHEPLAAMSGDLFVKLADARKLNIVGSVPDEMVLLGAYVGMQKMTPSMILKMFEQFGLVVDQSGGWLVLSSSSPGEARSQRVDRHVAGEYLRAVAAKGHASLDDMAAYATAIEGEMYNSLAFGLSMMITGNQNSDYYDHNMLKLYGLLGMSQRQALAAGQGINLNSLTEPQSKTLSKMIFGQNSDIMPIPQRMTGIRDPEEADLMYNGIWREPTELFGNGLPPDSTLKLTDQSERVLVVPSHENGQGVLYGARPMTPDEVAQQLYAKERPGIFPWMEADPGWDQRKFQLGTRRMLQFEFAFGTSAQMQKQLQDTKYEVAAPVAYGQLPEDFRTLVEKRLVDVRKQYANVKPGQLGGPGIGRAQPPPP